MAEKQNPKERLKEITDSIETGIKELFESDKYKSYLQTMSRFHKYSLNNTLLISMQKPDATLVAGFNKWRDGFSRHVKKGEKGIKIIAPTPYKIKEQREKLDPQTKAPILDASGKVQTEEVEIQIPMYRVVSVFDVSQTYGEPLPTLANNLTGNVEQFEVFMEAIKRTAPVPIEIKPLPENTDGYYHTEDKRIAIREGMSEVQTVSAAIHEVAHSLLHNKETEKELQAQQDESTPPIKPKDRNTEEVEAESISFAVCSYYGIQTSENSLGYIASWSKGKELAELRASLETINKTSSELISGIDKHFAEIVKERGIDLTAETALPEQAPDPNKGQITEEHRIDEPVQHDYPMPDPTVSIDDRNAYGYTADELLPLSKERAAELWEQDLPVFILYPDNTEAMIFDMEEMKDHDGLFGIETADWQAFHNRDKGKDHLPPQEVEAQFLEQTQNAFAIYQLKGGEDLRDYRFEGMDWLIGHGLTVDRANYELVYTAPLSDFGGDKDHALNKLYEQFNINHPTDFRGHSLSVSDIIALKVDGAVSSHYVDSFGFKELPQFLPSYTANELLQDELSTLDDTLYSLKIYDIHLTYSNDGTLVARDDDNLWTGKDFYDFLLNEAIVYEADGSIIVPEKTLQNLRLLGKYYGVDFPFMEQNDNPLRTAELSTEQNYNQIDGIINNQPTVAQLEQDAKSGKPISLMDLLDATRREEKQSVMEQLKAKPPQEQKKEKTAPSKGAEMER